MSKFVLDPGAGDLGDGGGCQGWVVQGLFGRSRTVPCGTAGALGVCSGFFGFRRPVEWVRAVSLEALVFWGGLVGHFL